MLSRLTYLAALFTVMLGLSACNTIDGAEEDLESAGDSIEEEVEEL